MNSSSAVEMLDVALVAAHAPGNVIIEKVNWSVLSGEFWAVGGPPGSGKSSLLATAAGLLRPARGVHRLFGRELAGLEEEELIRHRQRVGIVFGNEGRLFSQLTVAENVALPICYHRDCEAADAAERVNDLLEVTGLASIAQRLPGSVSRGVRPRIALARALALAPELLLLDNPLREIDPPQRRWWIEFLGSLGLGHRAVLGRRTTIVVASDDLRPWIGHAQKYALIAGNRWSEIGGQSDLERSEDPALREVLHDETRLWPSKI